LGIILTLTMKQRLSICLEKDLIKKIDYLLKNKYDGLASRSALIEHYLTEPKSILEDYSKVREETLARVLT